MCGIHCYSSGRTRGTLTLNVCEQTMKICFNYPYSTQIHKYTERQWELGFPFKVLCQKLR